MAGTCTAIDECLNATKETAMQLIIKSLFSGKMNTMDLDITAEQKLKWENGALIQDVMPQLNAVEREFLISGMTDEEWTECWGEEE